MMYSSCLCTYGCILFTFLTRKILVHKINFLISVCLCKRVEKNLDNKTNKYLNLLSKLEVLNPVTTLKRGYSITKKDNKSITSINDIKKDDVIITSLSDGYIESIVSRIENN